MAYMASSAGSDDGTLLDKKEAPPACPAWDPVPAVASGYCAVMGDEELWPPLPGSKVTPAAAAAKAPSSSAAPATPQATRATTNKGNLGPSSGRHGDRGAPAPERHAGVPESSSSPMHTSNHVNGGAGFRGRQNNGRFAQQPHGRGGGGYNNGSRRPVGGANGRGDVNVHVHINGNGYGNFNGGGFNNNGQHRGRSHPNGHWHGQGHRPSGPPPPPHHHPMHSPPPPFMGMVAPLMPYYDPYGAYGPYAYSAEYAPPGYYFPPAQEGLPFMPYPTLPMHMMPSHWEQQGAASSSSSSMEQQQQQDAPAPLTAEELQKAIRAQIEYYFSTNNLSSDTYLRQKMDNDGWVPLWVIADFPRVKEKSTDLDFIMTSVLPSDEVEVQDGKIRRRTGWEKYPLPRSN